MSREGAYGAIQKLQAKIAGQVAAYADTLSDDDIAGAYSTAVQNGPQLEWKVTFGNPAADFRNWLLNNDPQLIADADRMTRAQWDHGLIPLGSNIIGGVPFERVFSAGAKVYSKIAANPNASKVWSLDRVGGGTQTRAGGVFPATQQGGSRIVRVDPRAATRESFDNYAQFKERFGAASQTYGKGYTWEHIVEQGMANKVGARNVYSTKNTIPISWEINKAKADFYSTTMPGSNVTWRQWLSTQSFDQQYKFGIDTLRKLGVIFEP